MSRYFGVRCEKDETLELSHLSLGMSHSRWLIGDQIISFKYSENESQSVVL